MVLIQHLFGIPSLRQTQREIQVNLAYRWFLGYGLLDDIPHFATVSYAFCKRFPDELTTEIFEHILNKALNNRMVDEIHTPQRSGRSQKMGPAQICCPESEKTGKLELEQLLYFSNSAGF